MTQVIRYVGTKTDHRHTLSVCETLEQNRGPIGKADGIAMPIFNHGYLRENNVLNRTNTCRGLHGKWNVAQDQSGTWWDANGGDRLYSSHPK